MSIAELRKNDPVHGPRRKMRAGPYVFVYDCMDDSDADNCRFIYKVDYCPQGQEHVDGLWGGFYREGVGGFDIVGFNYGSPPAFIRMCEIARNQLARICVP